MGDISYNNKILTPVWIRGIHPWLEGHDEPLYQIDSIKQILSLLPS